jgi:hypothetical protein
MFLFLFLFLSTPHLSHAVFVSKVGSEKGSKLHIIALHNKTQNTLRLHFVQLKKIKSIQYSLTYTSQNIEQAISGNITLAGKRSLRRELFIGTCSTTECTPHLDPKNIRLEVVATYITGVTEKKVYQID